MFNGNALLYHTICVFEHVCVFLRKSTLTIIIIMTLLPDIHRVQKCKNMIYFKKLALH